MTKKIIFDLDGTLYKFRGDEDTFAQTQFYSDLKQHICDYISHNQTVTKHQAEDILENINTKYAGELSIGFEKEYGIDRYEYFRRTWGELQPENYVSSDTQLTQELENFRGNILLLTAAPRIWAERVLNHLGIQELFEDLIISGEPDIRKPDPAVFQQAKTLLGVEYECITSIGDQDYSDIVPAKKLGMRTIRIGAEQGSADHRCDSIVDALLLLKQE